ncbi:MAG TPA: NAD(P)-binding domain-containing protein, partial [Micromonosporaceae bacterium]
MTEKWVAVLGLGGIGGGVAHRLLGAGYQVRVYNRTADKARPLVAAGARPAPTPGSACANADVVVVSLSDERAVEQVIFGEVLADL